MSYKEDYYRKLKTVQEAADTIKSGDRVYLGTASSICYELGDALAARSDELENVTIASGLNTLPNGVFENKTFRHIMYFMGHQERMSLYNGTGDYSSIHLSQWKTWVNDIADINVAFFEVTPPDENGYMNFSSNGSTLNPAIREHADRIILSVNPNAVWVNGEDNLIHVSEADIITESETALHAIPEPDADETIQALSRHIVAEIPDGATIQLGAGRLGTAIGYGLMEKSDLGVHSEMISDSVMRLIQNGNVNNRKKTYYEGKTVIGFAWGSRELYDFLDHNEDCMFLPMEKVNNPINIAKNDNMISVNGAVEIDLTGQVAAETIRGLHYSGIGGQVDYVRGAQMAKGGKSIIATEATYGKGEKKGSRIVCGLKPGTAVTTSRADVQYVATEYGCINLKVLSMKDRVRAMISLAAPEFRDRLAEEAKAAHLL